MGSEIRSFVINWISVVISFQLIMVCVLAVLTCVLLLFRRWHGAQLVLWQERYSTILIDDLLADEGAISPVVIGQPKNWRWIRKQALRDALMEQLRSLSGSEKLAIAKRYGALGFVQEDIDHCFSVFWWKRLAAVVDLSELTADSLGPVFSHMKDDRNKLIATYAILALSELGHPLNNIKLFGVLPSLVQGRNNILLEIALNWSKVHPLKNLVVHLTAKQKQEIYDVIVMAIASLRSPEGAHELAKLLAHPNRCDADLLVEVIRSLHAVSDPSTTEAVGRYLYHPDAIVRLAALEFILAMDDDRFEDDLGIMMDDSSPTIRRLLSERKTAESDRSAA